VLTTRVRREFDLTETTYSADKTQGTGNCHPHKGFFFLQADGGFAGDVFCHANELQKSGIYNLERGQRVAFDVEQGPRGPRAINVELLP
jgi:cold shock protein